MLSIDFKFSERFANDEKIISQGEMNLVPSASVDKTLKINVPALALL